MRRRYASLDWWKLALGVRVQHARKSLFFRPYIYADKTHEGEPLPMYIANPTADAWYGRGTDPHNIEMRYVRDHMISPGMNILEAGGHHALDTILLARWVNRMGAVVSFEPLMENVAVMHANLGLNHIDNVTVEPLALGAQTGEVVMKTASSNGSVRPTGGKGEVVKVDTIDEYCARTGFVPDLIKIDVEGYELSVLAGARKALSDHPALLIEVHCDSLPKYNEDAAMVWDHVDRDAYEIVIQWDDLSQPVPYRNEEMHGRVHLFCTPRSLWQTESR